MKQFEKWWKENHYTHYRDSACKLGWRAALKCVQDIACKGGILQNDFVIREWIREELQNE